MLLIFRDEKVIFIVVVFEFIDDKYLVMLIKGGYIKKISLFVFVNICFNGLIVIFFGEGDSLRWVRRVKVDDSLIIGFSYGMVIYFRMDNK